jgi:hypothetical protein
MLRVAIVAGAVLAASAARAGEAQCWYENGAIVVAAAFGDIAGDFEIDPTAPVSLLHEDRANTAGLPGPTATAPLTIAGVRLRHVTVKLENFNEREVGFPTVINGVIGADLLARWVVQIDYSPCRIRLLRRAPPARPGALRLAMRMVGAIPAVAANASDPDRELAGLFAVDLASAGTRFVPDRITWSRPLPDGLDPTLRFRPPARLRALVVAKQRFEDTPAGTAEYPLPGLDGAIGNAVWDHFRVTLDIRRRRLTLEPSPPP